MKAKCCTGLHIIRDHLLADDDKIQCGMDFFFSFIRCVDEGNMLKLFIFLIYFHFRTHTLILEHFGRKGLFTLLHLPLILSMLQMKCSYKILRQLSHFARENPRKFIEFFFSFLTKYKLKMKKRNRKINRILNSNGIVSF